MEVLVVLVMLLTITWQPWRLSAALSAHDELIRVVAGAVAGVLVIGSWLGAHDTLASLGLRPGQWGRGLPSLACFTALGLLGVWLASVIVGRESLGSVRWNWLGQYMIGMAAQQILLQCFLNNRLHELGRNMTPTHRLMFAVVGSTFLFALLHAPNHGLVLFTGGAGAFWAYHFRVHRNLLGLAISHLILGAAAMIYLGNGPLMSLHVGWPAMRDLLRQ